MKYYDENRNGYYNPDDGQDSRLPGENANWKAIQAGFAASAAKDSQQDTDVASAANVAEAARRTADQALEAAQAAGGDITDLEAAVQAAQQTADGAASAAQAAQSAADGAASAAQSAGTAAAAAQTAADNAATAAQSASATASSALTAAQAAQTAADNAGTAAAAAQQTADGAASAAVEPTAYEVMASGMMVTYPQVIKPNRIARITTSGGTVSPLGDYTVPDGIYHVIPDSNVTVFPPESIGGAPTNVFGINGRDMPIFGSPYDQMRFGITITGGVISGKVYFDVQSSDLAADVTLAQASLVQVLLYLTPARYAEVSGS